MAEPFMAEIRIFGLTYSPRSWAKCAGQILSISQSTALFSLLGTNFGGDGRTTFGVPDLQGRAPMHAGSGIGLTTRPFSTFGGVSQVALAPIQLPKHDHVISGVFQAGNTDQPSDNQLAIDVASSGGALRYTAPLDSNTSAMSSSSLAQSGRSQRHENMQPSLALNFCIALDGIYPPRN
ncbi:phage tail protein [Pseudoalteromonas sp. SG45-5]|jgi:microcystin-dependent protein|uniref:Phage tail protein n=1 Tax=Pseudoalteromonas aliena TaxID=247523 RepID=A0A1Q2H376_9GAMM|nr:MULTISPECIES: tail fiber protein [Pseudoalteromonas]AQQ01803.1 phage tail protein [Pseudoalteromonas aliena]MBB1384640.1 phage tail protein [Pseudoalteromonas sp. SG45-5]MBB1392631.1 phage tail protein [Pseudoalteromonas sp. SG44-4]MBB1449305.1 phage tail protein [Pseudoalteromonas sp. SG41-6]